MADGDLTTLAAQAYIYGFPLIFDLQEVVRFNDQGIGMVPATPFNAFGHATELAGPEATFVSINNDTVYSIANLDVSAGPVRLDVPDTHSRYYVLQFVDAWTNNFAYVGHRATGTAAGSFLLVASDWTGEEPQDARVIHLPTTVATIVGRWAVAGEDDLPAVRELQAGLRLTPTATGRGVPDLDLRVPEDLEFFERLRVWMQAFPPAERDRPIQKRFAALGLLESQSPYLDPSPALVEALRDGQHAGREQMEAALKGGGGPRQNGWDLTYHVFDYNLDFFEVGALDEPQWKLPDGPARYMQRALAARGGLWGNHGYEAAYAMTYLDGDDNPLEGDAQYELTFTREPPVRAFWSVTMYNTPEYFLVANPIDRYSIGDRTSGLRRGDDGSLTIVMQREAPTEPARRANWLPTPSGPVRPILRMYEPEPAVFDGGFELPPIRRVG